MNAILVEEAMSNGFYHPMLSNPTGSDKIFDQNMIFLKHSNFRHNLFSYIYNCPLIQCYINTDVDDPFTQDLKKIIVQNNPKTVFTSKVI